MSSHFSSFKLFLKKIEVFLRSNGPDHYIFESNGMAETATKGRGIAAKNTSVVYLGIDTEKFKPNIADHSYVYSAFNIPPEKRIFFYAGHMEPRKGVATIMEAANLLIKSRKKEDWVILLFGNRNGDEQDHINRLSEPASKNVIFGGYRNDINLIQRGCYAAIIASTGWDSFPRSGVEMQASGLPLIASDLPGLRESVLPKETGFLFPPGDSIQLSLIIRELLDNPSLQETLSAQARSRAVEKFSSQVQLDGLVATVRKIIAK